MCSCAVASSPKIQFFLPPSGPGDNMIEHATRRGSRALLASGILLCALASRAAAGSSVPAEHPAWGGFFSEALDDSDLDVRDAHNRPVRGVRARVELKELFTAAVFTLLSERPLPLAALADHLLDEWLTPFAERLVRSGARLGR